MNFFLSATDYDLSIVDGQTGTPLRTIHLSKGWLRSGCTRAEFAITLLETLTKINTGKEVTSWRSLKKAFRREPSIRELFEEAHNARFKFFSNDPTMVESLLRHVFGEFRDVLPLIVYSVPQHYECWLNEPWTRPIEVSSIDSLTVDAINALKAYQFISEQIEVRRQQKEAIAAQERASRDLKIQEQVERSYTMTTFT
jgi:hypothetical protein